MPDLVGFHRIAATQDVCGEAPLWHRAQGALFWTDINRGLVHRCYPSQEKPIETWSFDQPVTAIAQTTDPASLLLVLGGRIILWDPARDQIHTTLFKLDEWPKERCNDAGVGPTGELWFGTMENNVNPDRSTKKVGQRCGRLISLSKKKPKVWASGFGIVNTILWSPSGNRMFFADTLDNKIFRVPFAAGVPDMESCSVFLEGFSRGLPDGSAMDVDGYIWNCRYGGGCIVRIAPDGRVDRTIDVPVQNPTSCSFGGEKLDELYITSASESGEPSDLSGSVYRILVRPNGLAAGVFEV